MPYPVSQLIGDAYFTSGVVGRGFQNVNGDSRSVDGLRLLNQIILEKSMDAVFIPYDLHTTFNTVAGQEKYFVSNLIKLNTLTFNMGIIRYPLIRDNINRYFATGRADNVQSLPVHYFAERALSGMNIYFYFLPSSTFVVNVDGRFAYNPVSINGDLEIQFDPFQILYFQYKLAERLCDYYTFPFSEAAKAQLDNLERRFNNLSGEDLSISKYSFSTVRDPYNYAWGILGRGWVPG